MSSQTLTPLRVVITTHNPSGTTIIASDTYPPPFHPFGPNASSFSTIHTSPTIPASNTAPLPYPITTTVPRPFPSGILLCTIDIPPGASSPMHRTLSLDYACVLSGAITMKLDGAEEVVLGKGEVVVQRGGMHLWSNHTEEPCRILFVMVGSEKIVTEKGKVLGAFFPGREVNCGGKCH